MDYSRSKRILRLEACRGIAALVVVASHSLLAFMPSTEEALSKTPFYLLINGIGAVMFFFVLSGYVLTVRFFREPKPEEIVVSIVKRLPRLALLTTIVSVSSAVLWRTGAYHFEEAGNLAHSGWLIRPISEYYQPGIFEAVKQGAWRTFTSGDSYLDSSLWTMVHEFHGSMLVFVIAPLFVYVIRDRLIAWPLVAFAILIFRAADPFMIPFLCGMAIASIDPEQLPKARWLLGLFFFVGIACLEFHDIDWKSTQAIMFGTLGAGLIVIVILRSATASAALENRFGGILGYLSFPIYLVHVPIIWSAGSLAFLRWGSALPAIAVTVALTLLVAWPLAALDRAWVRRLQAFGKFQLMPLR